MLVKLKEDENNVNEAAKILQEVQVNKQKNSKIYVWTIIYQKMVKKSVYLYDILLKGIKNI